MAVNRAGGVWFNAYHRYHGFFAGENAGCDAVGQGPGDALTHVINIKKICFFLRHCGLTSGIFTGACLSGVFLAGIWLNGIFEGRVGLNSHPAQP